MLETIDLPKDKKALAQILDQHADREEMRLSYRRAMWAVALYYMLGARNFDVFDPYGGRVHFRWLDEDGNLDYQSQELLSAVDRVSGRMASMDLRPMVARTGSSLEQIRGRAIGQIIADSLVNPHHLETLITKYMHLFALLGSCGMIGHLVDHPTIGLHADLQLIHPKELFPFPSLGEDYTRQQGIMWQRLVPLEHLKRVFGRKVATNKDSLEYWTVEIGEEFEYGEMSTILGGMPSTGLTVNTPHVPFRESDLSGRPGRTQVEIVRVRELWTFGANELVQRYVVASGDYILQDEDTRDVEVYCPIGFDRFMENGSFHGAGIFDLLFSNARQAEKMAKSLFKNIADLDRYGVLVMPHGSFNQNTVLRDIGHGLKVFPWEPDPISEGFRPFAIRPFNSGDIPGRTASFALDLLDRVNPLQDLIREKGRVDSAAGLSFLDEQINRAMTTPTRGVQHTLATVYRALVGAATREITMSQRAIPVGSLTSDLAGAIIDPQTMDVSFSRNPLPNIGKLRFGVRQVHPRSEVARKQEALELQQRLGTPYEDFILLSLKEGLDFALWVDEDQSAYEMVIRNIVMLYGDGVRPGRIIVVPFMTKPNIQVRVLNAFMTSPVMSVASPMVQDEFIKYREALQEQMGLALPNAVPNPDDVAMLTELDQALMKLQAQEGASNGQASNGLPAPALGR